MNIFIGKGIPDREALPAKRHALPLISIIQN
jgi:hypothetical protein